MNKKYFILMAVLLIASIRLVHINADIPDKYIDGGFALTDEGWYVNGALGVWHEEGDINMSIALPVHSLLRIVPFAIFGPSLALNRSITALFFIGFIFLLFLICEKLFSFKAAILAIVAIVFSQLCFVYSRIALLEFEALFFVCALIVVLLYHGKNKHVISGILFTVAMLTKPSIMFMVVPICILIYGESKSWKSVLCFLVSFVGSYFIYIGLMLKIYPEDISYFFGKNVSERAAFSFKVFARIYTYYWIAPVLAIPFVAAALQQVKSYKTQFCLVSLTMCLAMFSLNGYQPGRYFTLFSLPICLCMAISLDNVHGRNLIAPLLVIIPLLIIEAFSCCKMIVRPTYSYYNSAITLKDIIKKSTKNPIICGEVANSISVVTGISSIGLSKELISTHRPLWIVLRMAELREYSSYCTKSGYVIIGSIKPYGQTLAILKKQERK